MTEKQEKFYLAISAKTRLQEASRMLRDAIGDTIIVSHDGSADVALLRRALRCADECLENAFALVRKYE